MMDLGDVLRESLGGPLKAPEPEQITAQVREPSKEELDALEKLAADAAALQDKLRDATGTMGRDLNAMKAKIRQQMIDFGMDEIKIAGRPPIELSSSNSTKPSQKGIVAACTEIKGDKVEGKKLAMDIWKRLGTTTSYSLSIPDVAPPDA